MLLLCYYYAISAIVMLLLLLLLCKQILIYAELGKCVKVFWTVFGAIIVEPF